MPTDQPRRSHVALIVVLFCGLAIALAANVYQFVRGEQVSREVEQLRQNTQGQIAKLNDAATAALDENQQRFEAMKNQLEGATTATLRQARSEVNRTSSRLSQSLDQKHKEAMSQLSDLKENTSAKLDQVNGDLEKTGTDLKRVMGDLGVMSGEVATNSKQLSVLRELGERNYYEFDLHKTKDPQKVGDIRLILKNADTKHSRFTVAVYADDKIVEKKDRTINEPVQLYVAGSRQPYEIVVNQVKKNEVIGYLATPKAKAPRGQASE